MSLAPSSTRAGRREWTVLSVLCLPLLIVSMDVSVLFFAVPQIAASLEPSATQLLWIFDVYGFVLAGLLLTMGNVADRIGRRRLLLLGAVAFAGASVLAAYAPSVEWLIVARALLGLGGSTLMPSTLAIVRNVFTDEADRAKAIGIWSAVLASGVGLGPIVAGVLLEYFWWGSVFLINVPAMALLFVLGPVLLPESKAPSAGVDLVSAVLSFATILPIIHALKEFAADGWSVPVALFALGGLASGAAFVWRQGLAHSPMVDLTLFRNRGFGGSVAIQVIGMFGVMGNAVLTTQYLQSVLGLSALSAALWGLAPAVLVGASAPAAAVLSVRIGRPPVMAGAFVVAAMGFVGLRSVQVDSSIWVVLVAASFVAMGLVAVATLVTEYAIGVAPAERAGSVSALVETASEFGGALGMAILGSIVSAVYVNRFAELVPASVPADVAESAGETLGEATVVASPVGGSTGGELLNAARVAFVDGMHVTGLVAAGVMVVGAVIALVALPRKAVRDPQSEAAPREGSPADATQPSGIRQPTSRELTRADGPTGT